MTYEDFGDIEFAENSDPRSAVIFVLDNSSSMGQVLPGETRSPLDALNSGLDVLVSALRKDTLTRRRVELSFVCYGTEVAEPTPYSTVDDIVLPELTDMGITNTGLALNVALDSLEERTRTYKENGIQTYQPSMFWLSDGLSMDDLSGASARIKELEAKKKLSFFPIALEGSDIDEMSKVGSRPALQLSGMKFEELFEWVSQSQLAVSSSQVGDKVALPVPSGWAEL